MQRPPVSTPPPARPSLGTGRPSDVRSSGSNAGVIVLILIGIGAVIAGIVALVIVFLGNTTKAFLPDATASVRDVRALRDRNGGVVYVGEIENSGDGMTGSVSATLTLFDASHAPLGSKTCAPSVLHLAPHERVPCVLSFGAVANPATMGWKVDAKPADAAVQPAALVTSGVVLGTRGSAPTLDGTVRNTSAFAAKRVVVFATLYAADKSLLGAAQMSLSSIEPGATAPFSVPVASFGAAPVTFAARAVGYR